jgi:subtilisin family serine protease
MDQIEAAQTQGRNGRGCVVLAAAGNEGGPVAFPASFDGVIAVAASNQFDKVKTHDSADGETWWGSNHGPEIAVAAPGVANITTSVRRKASGPGVYVDSFNGTSAATPIVAGACALLLSLRPDLSAAQVRDLLCATADRIGPFPYKNGRNNHAGHGRINLRRAVEAAQALPPAQ